MMFWMILPILFIFFFLRDPAERSVAQHSGAGHDSLPKNEEARIFRLAQKRGAVLTVSDVIVELELGAEEAERLLDRMTDGLRVRMEMGSSGLARYVFTELLRTTDRENNEDVNNNLPM